MTSTPGGYRERIADTDTVPVRLHEGATVHATCIDGIERDIRLVRPVRGVIGSWIGTVPGDPVPYLVRAWTPEQRAHRIASAAARTAGRESLTRVVTLDGREYVGQGTAAEAERLRDAEAAAWADAAPAQPEAAAPPQHGSLAWALEVTRDALAEKYPAEYVDVDALRILVEHAEQEVRAAEPRNYAIWAAQLNGHWALVEFAPDPDTAEERRRRHIRRAQFRTVPLGPDTVLVRQIMTTIAELPAIPQEWLVRARTAWKDGVHAKPGE